MRRILHAQMRGPLSLLACSSLAIIWAVYLLLFSLQIPNTFIILLIALLLFTEKWYFTLCWISVYSLVINICTTIVAYLYFIIFAGSINSGHNYSVFTDCLVILVIFFLLFFLEKKVPSNFSPLEHIHLGGYCLIAFVIIIDFLLSVFSSVLFFMDLNRFGRHFLIVAIFVTVIMSLAILFLYLRLRHYNILLKQADEVKLKLLQLEEQHYRELQQKTMDLRAFRHDYNFHITAMQGLIAENDTEGLKRYVAALAKNKESVYYISTNHPVGDAIANYFYENKPENSDFYMEGKFPEEIFVDDSDLCIVFSNLLKNAVEALERLPEGCLRKIYVSLFASPEYINLTVENTCDPDQEKDLEELATSKIDTINHGLGLKNVRSVVERYDGRLDLEVRDNIFSAFVLLRNINS